MMLLHSEQKTPAEKIEALRAEVERLKQDNRETRAIYATIEANIFDRMGELRLGHLSFNYGDRMIGAFDFDGELVGEGVTLMAVFEEAAAALGNEDGE